MDIHNKTKEELISKLQELLHDSDSLKALKEKRAAELSVAIKKIKESEERYRTMFEQAPLGVALIHSYTGKIKNANAMYEKIVGRTIEELSTIERMSITHPDDVQPDSDNMALLNSGKVNGFQMEKRYIHRNGDIVWVNMTIAPIVVEDKTNPHHLCMVKDISERKRLENTHEIMLNISNAVVTTDNLKKLIRLIQKELGKIIDTTNFFIALYDHKTDTLSLPFMADKKDKFTSFPAVKTLTYYVIKTQKPLLATAAQQEDLVNKGEIEFVGSRSKIWLGVPLKIEGKVTGVLAVQSYTDENVFNEEDMKMLEFVSGQVSTSIERKKAEQDLIKALEKAQESNRLKSAFLANMSHEIRTPMNGILGFAELLKQPDLTSDQQQEYIRIIEKARARMLNIINDIVSISKIESGTMEVSNKESNINEQIEYIYTFFKPEVEAKGMKLSFKNTLPTKESIIKTDREKFFAILTNFIKNAIKYSKEGEIKMGYIVKGDYMEFYVKDTGIGIPKNRQKAIFERFIQADVEDKMARQGAGLGLSISKAYVEILGGKIWVESEEGVGSTFYFTLPYQINSEEKLTVKDIVSTKGEENNIRNLKILITEDNETSEMLISIIVNEFCTEVLKAKTGKEAVEICRKNSDINLILMDIQMPDMNGYKATRQIRKFNKDVIIIAQTAYGLLGDREKALEAGCNDYISKPIKKDELLALIQKCFKKI